MSMTSQLSLCAQEVRKHDHDQFLCGLFVAEEKQNTFFALQVLHLETVRIRDMVSDPQLGLMRLQWWRDLIDSIYGDTKTEQVENGTHREIVEALQSCEIDPALFTRYFNARSFDMEDRTHDDMNALLRYAEATGGVMAQIKEAAIGYEVSDAARLIGTAQALSYLLKTLAHQSRSGRCKIPLSLVRQHELDMKDFASFTCNPALKACVKELVQHSRDLIAQARKSRTRSNPVLLNSVAIEDHLNRLEKVEFDPFTPEIGGGRLKRQLKLGYRAMRNRY